MTPNFYLHPYPPLFGDCICSRFLMDGRYQICPVSRPEKSLQLGAVNTICSLQWFGVATFD